MSAVRRRAQSFGEATRSRSICDGHRAPKGRHDPGGRGTDDQGCRDGWRDGRRRVRVGTRPQGRRCGAGRSARLSAVPAAALSGREFATAGRGRRPAAAAWSSPTCPSVRVVQRRRDRHRLRQPDGHHRRRRPRAGRLPGPGRRRAAELLRRRRAPASTPSRCTRSRTPNGCGCICTNCCGCTATPRAPAPEPLNVVIVGGGPTGVETAGAIAELFNALREDGPARRHGRRAPGGPRQGAAGAVLRQVPRVRAGRS